MQVRGRGPGDIGRAKGALSVCPQGIGLELPKRGIDDWGESI